MCPSLFEDLVLIESLSRHGWQDCHLGFEQCGWWFFQTPLMIWGVFVSFLIPYLFHFVKTVVLSICIGFIFWVWCMQYNRFLGKAKHGAYKSCLVRLVGKQGMEQALASTSRGSKVCCWETEVKCHSTSRGSPKSCWETQVKSAATGRGSKESIREIEVKCDWVCWASAREIRRIMIQTDTRSLQGNEIRAECSSSHGWHSKSALCFIFRQLTLISHFFMADIMVTGPSFSCCRLNKICAKFYPCCHIFSTKT